MPIIRCIPDAKKAIVAAMQYQEKIYQLENEGRIEEANILRKSRASKIEDYLILSGICNAKNFE